jgi:hypothetical protein
MGSEQFNEVKESIAGSWLLDRSENFDEALKAMGW